MTVDSKGVLHAGHHDRADKGGAAKTTTAMLFASAALSAGHRVSLIDGDVNAQLGRWRDSFELASWESVKKPAWPETFAILSPPESVEGLLSLLESEEARGVDLVAIDIRPGTHTDTEDLCLVSDLVLIPARPVFAEWKMTHRAVLWMDDLRASLAEGERFRGAGQSRSRPASCATPVSSLSRWPRSR